MAETLKKLSIVTPVYKNASTLKALVEQCEHEVSKLVSDFEHIFVIDGSPDNSFEILHQICENKAHVKVITLSRNFGQHVALRAGMDAASGDCIVLIDADLEENPKYISIFFEKIKSGAMLVIGRRSKRRNRLFKRVTAQIYSSLFNYLSDYKIIDDATNMRIMRREYVDFLKAFPEKPFLGGLTAWIGVEPVIVDVEFEESSRSSYTLRKLLSHARAGLLGFSIRPLRVGFGIGMVVCFASLAFALWNLLRYLSGLDVLIGYTSTIVIFSFLIGTQFIFLGILGEYIAEIFLSTKARPLYIVASKKNFK